ncbi:DNA polymerase III subunit beta [Nocardia terpenica]|uniref:DNA polymerase III subunit beta n=1 Tax=Nocardia terpenica TaxID=455432 RepID=UPI0009EF6A9B|nr:DNA polymerase III subunit beta [Nocardia terpenica]
MSDVVSRQQVATFTADLKTLASDILFIKRVTGFRRAHLPVLELATVTVRDGVAAISFYNFDAAVTVRMPGAGDDTCFAVNLNVLADAVKAVGATNTGTFTMRAGELRIAAAGVAVTVPLAGAELTEDMPVHPVVDGTPVAIVPGAEFARLGAITATAVGRDTDLPMLTGVRVECSGTHLHAVTTDRYKVAIAEATNRFCVAEDTALLVPGHPFHHFAKRAGSSGTVTVSVGANGMVSLESDDCTVAVNQLDHEYVKWRNLLPSTTSVSFTFDPAALLRAVKAMPKGASTINLHISDGEVRVVGYSGREESPFSSMLLDVTDIECDQDMVIKFSAPYVATILGAVPKGVKVQWRGTTPTRPALFVWESARVLLMPVRIPG